MIERLSHEPLCRNCLFRALSDQLNGGATSHEELRDRVVSYMRSHRRDFEVFLDEEDESFDKYSE